MTDTKPSVDAAGALAPKAYAEPRLQLAFEHGWDAAHGRDNATWPIYGRAANPAERPADLVLREALAIDVLWDEPDPGTEDAAEGKVWLTDFEDDGIPRSFADALRALRAALTRTAEQEADLERQTRRIHPWTG